MQPSFLLSLVRSTLERGDDRDKQRRIGPSEIGNTCQRCLADRFLGVETPARRGYPLAPWIGTAVHAHLESLLGDDAMTETKVHVGDIPGYGPVSGTADVYKDGHLGDYKVMSKRNIAALKRAFVIRRDGSVAFTDTPKAATAQQYWIQQNLYAKGLQDAGHGVEDCTLILIPRDATTDTTEAITSVTFKADRAVAERALDRAGSIYEWAASHRDDLDELPSAPECFHCKYNRKEKS